MLQIVGVGVAAGTLGWLLCRRRWAYRNVEDMVDYLSLSYELGKNDGVVRYMHDEDQPNLTPLAEAYEPCDGPMDLARLQFALGAFGRGRFDGWWEEAHADLVVGACSLLEQSTKEEGK